MRSVDQAAPELCYRKKVGSEKAHTTGMSTIDMHSDVSVATVS